MKMTETQVPNSIEQAVGEACSIAARLTYLLRFIENAGNSKRLAEVQA